AIRAHQCDVSVARPLASASQRLCQLLASGVSGAHGARRAAARSGGTRRTRVVDRPAAGLGLAAEPFGLPTPAVAAAGRRCAVGSPDRGAHARRGVVRGGRARPGSRPDDSTVTGSRSGAWPPTAVGL